MGVTLLYSIGYKLLTVMDGVKFEINDIIIFLQYKKNDSERRQTVSLGYYQVYLMILL